MDLITSDPNVTRQFKRHEDIKYVLSLLKLNQTASSNSLMDDRTVSKTIVYGVSISSHRGKQYRTVKVAVNVLMAIAI